MRVPLSNRRFNRLSSGNPFTSRQCWIKCARATRLQASFWYTGDVNGRTEHHTSFNQGLVHLFWFRFQGGFSPAPMLFDPAVSRHSAWKRIDASSFRTSLTDAPFFAFSFPSDYRRLDHFSAGKHKRAQTVELQRALGFCLHSIFVLATFMLQIFAQFLVFLKVEFEKWNIFVISTENNH